MYVEKTVITTHYRFGFFSR